MPMFAVRLRSMCTRAIVSNWGDGGSDMIDRDRQADGNAHNDDPFALDEDFAKVSGSENRMVRNGPHCWWGNISGFLGRCRPPLYP
jgi:hypothetical protein